MSRAGATEGGTLMPDRQWRQVSRRAFVSAWARWVNGEMYRNGE